METIDLTADERPPLHRHRQRRLDDEINHIYGITDDGFRNLSDVTLSEDEEPLDGHDNQLRGGLTMDYFAALSVINETILYDNYALCKAAVHAHSAAAGFEYAKPSRRKFDKNNQLRKQPLVCAKGMSKRNLQAVTTRDVDSKKSACPMSICLNAIGDSTGRWKATLGKSEGSHNHAATKLSSLANHRRRARGSKVRKFLLSAR